MNRQLNENGIKYAKTDGTTTHSKLAMKKVKNMACHVIRNICPIHDSIRVSFHLEKSTLTFINMSMCAR